MKNTSDLRFYPCGCRGFTLVELMVAVAVMAMLVSVSIVGISRVRLSTMKVESTNNLRSIGQGMQLYLLENHYYPGSGGSNPYARWMNRVAPYMGFSPVDAVLVGEDMVLVYQDAGFEPVFHSPHTDKDIYMKPAKMTAVGVYGINSQLVTGTDLRGVAGTDVMRPERTVLLTERYSGRDAVSANTFDWGAPYPQSARGPAANYRPDRNPGAGAEGPGIFLFVDGHVRMVDMETLSPWPGKMNEVNGVRFGPTLP